MDDDQKQRTDSLLPYERWIEQALRHVVPQAIEHVAQHGFPGGHHFYLTFRTSDPGVEVPPRLRAQYPKEMTIVLQHQFWDLGFDQATQSIRVGLSFGGVPAKLSIPLDAVVEFADPHIRYGLRFPSSADADDAAPADAAPADPGSETAGPGSSGSTPAEAGPEKAAEPAQIVSLDAFRRRSPQV